MAKIIILKGLPASGKSTWAKKYLSEHLNTKRVNKDLLREMVDCGAWSGDKEKEILNVRDKLILDFLSKGYDVIVDDTNLSSKHELRIKGLAPKGTEIIIEDSFLSVPLETCIMRDKERPNPVGERVIVNMYNQFLNKGRPPVSSPTKTFEDVPQYPAYDDKKNDCVICDIDGTLALRVTGRSPYDLTRVKEDGVNEPVQTLLRFFFSGYEGGLDLVFVSGRYDTSYDDTYEWIVDNVSYFVKKDNIKLFMRPAGDDRNDALIKKEIYQSKIEPFYNVIFVLDDRDRVVKAWRELNLPCFQVAPGNF